MADTINLVLFGVLFGFMRAYQGLSGQIITGIAGVLYALVFHFRKSDLWLMVFAHGLFDTMTLGLIYFGIDVQ